MAVPMIRLEVEGMKHSMIQAMSSHLMQMDGEVKEVIDRVCTPENILLVIEQTAKQEIENAIKEEISNFYRFGGGRAAIRKAVEGRLGENGSV